MQEISELQHAIETLEAQRGLLGDAVVNTALAPMRDRLRQLQAQTATEERRLVTILFADLVDFTALTRRLDAEDVRELVNAYFTRWTAAIERHGGVVEKFAGDAVMAVFGLVQSTDLDPIQAVRAAMTMGRELALLNRRSEPQYGVRLQMRTGIHTGHAVVSTLRERRGQDFVIVGDSVNLASRLQALAPVDGIVVSHATFQHVSREFELKAFPPTPIKGFEQPVAYYSVVGERPHVDLAFDSASALAPLVGRDAVFASLQAAWRHVLAYQSGRLIALVGGAGLGKSRILLEFERWVRRQAVPIHLFVGRSLPALRDTPYGLLRDLFAQQFGIQDSDAPEVVERKLRAAIQSVLPNQPDAAGLIGRLLGFTPEAAASRGLVEDPKVLQNQAIARLTDYFTALSADRPVVALIEDLHWADDSSLELLERLNRGRGGRRLLLVCTARPEMSERRPTWRADAEYVQWIDLTPLSAADAGRLLLALLEPAANVPPQLTEQIITAADGNPFFVEEIVKVLIEDGVIDTAVLPWVIDEGRLQQTRLPQTLAGVLQARLDSLQSEARIALQQAAVIGRVFWDQAVEFLAEQSAAAAGDMAAALATLYQRELVFSRPISSFERTQEYLFKHALMRDVAYGSVLKRTRRGYHRLAAQWLEEVTLRSRRSDEFAALIAQHYDTAEESEPAAAWYLQAGRQAARSFANAEALRAFSRATELLSTNSSLDPSPGLLYAALAERERVYDLLGQRAEQAADLEQMAALVMQLDDPLAEAETSLRRSQLALAQGDYPLARDTVLAAAELARGAQAAALEASALLQHGQILLRQGEYAAALAQMQGAWRLAHAAGDRSLGADSLHGQAMAQVFMGEFDAAQASFEAALAEAVAVGNRRLECTLLNRLSWVPVSRNEYTLAISYIERSLALSREIGDRAAEGNALTNLGNCYIQLSDFAHGEAYTREALAIYRELGDPGGECATLDNLGNNAWGSGDFAAAVRFKEEALVIARRIGDRQTETNILGNLGIVTCDIGDLETAQEYMFQALALAREDGNRSIESTVLTNLSTLVLWQGHAEAALEHARTATDLALELGAQRDRINALDALGAAYLALGDAAAALAIYREEQQLALQEAQPNHAVNAVAHQARALLALGDLPQALVLVEIVLAHLDRLTPNSTYSPTDVFYACSQVLAAAGDPRYDLVLEQAHVWVQNHLERLEDEAHRRAFVENVPARAALIAAWRERNEGVSG